MQLNTKISRRSVLAGIGAGLAAGALAACAPGAPGKTGSFGQPDGKVPAEFGKRQRVVVWTTWGGETGAAVAALAQQFNESQEDVYVDLQSQNSSYDELAQKLAAGIQARVVPDVALFSEVTWHKFFLNETLEPLDQYFGTALSTDAYNQPLLDEGRLADDIWWLPFARSTPLFYYNRDLFAQVGLPDRAPKTWSEMLEWAPELQGATFNNSKPQMHAFPQVDGDWMFQGKLWNWGGAISDGLDVMIDDERSVAAGEWDRALVHDAKMAYMAESPVTDFTNGLIATAHDSTGAMRRVVTESKFEVGVGFVPGETEQVVPTGGSGFSIMAGAPEDRKAAAFTFLEFLARPDVAAQWTVATGYMPVIEGAKQEKSYTDLVAENPSFGLAVEQLAYTRKEDDVRLFVPNANITIYQGLQRIWTKNEPAGTVLADVAADLRKAVEEIRPTYEARVS